MKAKLSILMVLLGLMGCQEISDPVALENEARPPNSRLLPASNGVVGWWPGDLDGSDVAGTNDGTLEGGMTAGNSGGHLNGAFLFDGVDDGLNLGNVSEADFSQTSSFTLEAWINTSGPGDHLVQAIFSLNDLCAPSAGQLQLLYIYQDTLRLTVRDENNVATGLTAGGPITTNTLHHVAAVREATLSGAVLRLYVDGNLVGSTNDVTTGVLSQAADDFIGRRFPCGAPSEFRFNGIIDEAKIHAEALSDGDVLAIYANDAPAADANGPYTGTEGSALIFDGSGSSDPDGDALTHEWDFETDATVDATGENPSHTYADNGTYTVTLKVSDPSDSADETTTQATIANVAPTVDPISGPQEPIAVSTAVNIGATFSDPGILDTHTAQIDWDENGVSTTSAGIVTELDGSGIVTGSHTYAEAGVYTVKVTVTDDDGDSGESFLQYVVVYDPTAGFVTGGGWFDSPAGAYAADPSLMGRATFGFVSRYKKGASTPDGQTQFEFKAGNVNFHGYSYDWLVVAGPKAQYKGLGRINGTGEYGFLLTAQDGQVSGGGGVDRFRIKIWDRASEQLIYDNQMDDADDADVIMALGGGSIVIHKK